MPRVRDFGLAAAANPVKQALIEKLPCKSLILQPNYLCE
jgi:hypothetical protein